MRSEIQDYILRFVVPFHLKENLKENDFQYLRSKGWEEEQIIYGESDLYDYIIKLVSAQGKSVIGSSWKLNSKKYSQETYVTNVENRNIEWRFKGIGLVLFDTGTGIIWYQIANKTEFRNLEEFQKFISKIKELAKRQHQQVYKICSLNKDRIDFDSKERQEMEITGEIESREGVIVKGRKKIQIFEDVLFPFFEDLEIDTFFCGRNGTSSRVLPDRAISFVWVLNTPKEIEELAMKECVFKLGRCYTDSYSMNKSAVNDRFFKPFDDSIWYVSLEGCANYIVPKNEKKFYSQGYKGKLCNYFYLFLLCVGQYYSLIELTKNVLDISTKSFEKIDKEDSLEELLYKIHMFNIKNNYSQVGSITHYNEFYSYLRIQINIDEMNHELDENLQCLYGMIEEKKEVKKSKRYMCISTISAIFVVLELFGNLAQVLNLFLGETWKDIDKIWLIFGVIVFIAVVISIGVFIGKFIRYLEIL